MNCEPPLCSLHFHMDTSEYARLGVFSTESAPGIIIAHGISSSSILIIEDQHPLCYHRDAGRNIV